MIDSYGRAHLPAAVTERNLLGVLLPSAGSCLGVMIKDTKGNTTGAHHNVSQRYSLETVIADVTAHIETFHDEPKKLFLTLAGLGLGEAGSLQKLLPGYKDLRNIKGVDVITALKKQFPTTQFISRFALGKLNPKSTEGHKLLTTDMYTINNPHTPIATNQYWFTYPF
jgi:hypothetical protein